MPYSPRKLTEDRNRISATYLNHGYLNAEVKVQVQPKEADPHRVNVVYTIAEHQMVRINDVVYLGQKQTRLPLIVKTAKLPPETPMQRGGLLEAESRLYDLNIFDWSSVGPRKPITDQNNEEALVKVHEAKRNEITYGFGFRVSHRGGNVPTGTIALPEAEARSASETIRLRPANRRLRVRAAWSNLAGAICAAWERRRARPFLRHGSITACF